MHERRSWHRSMQVWQRRSRSTSKTEVTLIQRNRELLALQSAAAATSSSLDLPFLFDTVTWEMVNLMQSDGCIIYELVA